MPASEGEQLEAPTGGQDNVSYSFLVSPRNLSRGDFVGVHCGVVDTRNRLSYLSECNPLLTIIMTSHKDASTFLSPAHCVIDRISRTR